MNFLDASDAIQLLIVIILLFLSAFFSSAETALTACNKIRMRALSEEGDQRARTVLEITDQSPKMLSAILICNNAVNLYASALVTAFTIHVFGNKYVGIGTGVITLLVLIFAEVSPKTAANVNADELALVYAGPVRMLMLVLTPLIVIINALARVVLFIMRVDPDAKPETITESDFRTYVDASQEEGVLEKEEQKMINNVVDFGDTQAKDAMIPRVNMVFINIDAGYQEVMETFKEEMFTRLPVYQDTTDTIVGILNMKDLLFYDDKVQEFHVKDFMREAFFTYEFKKTSELFVEMREKSCGMAIVLDEYGVTAGLVTMEDLLEEIVGEIHDEFDASEREAVEKIGDRSYRVDGSINLDDLDEATGLSIESENYDSLGGHIIGLLDHIPEAGEEVEENGVVFHVETVENNRIEKVIIKLPEPAAEEAAE